MYMYINCIYMYMYMYIGVLTLTAVLRMESTKKSTTILIHLAWFDSTG